MADQIQTAESGGGDEGATGVAPVVVQPAPETKDTLIETPKAESTSEAKLEPKTENLEKPKEALTEIQPEPPKETQVEANKEIKSEEPNEVKPEQPVEVKPEQPQEVEPNKPKDVKEEIAAVPENKIEATPEESKQTTDEVKSETNGAPENVTAVKDQGDWQHRESELLKKIDELENVKKERTKDNLLLELKVREEEIDLLKARVKNLETELQAALSKPSGKNHEMIENIKQQHEELLSKARGMIFDKTKMVKNQELQIEALNTQIASLKDINQITKDLLEIRNSEIKAMEDRLQAMEARFKAEKERYGLVLQRAQTSSNINDDLRKEYETQLVLFKQLREKYDQRVQALVAENERLKGLNPANLSGAGTSG